MENIAVGVGLFVLIIVLGLIIALRLSSSGPQRRAVVVAFVMMALVSALFCVFAMGASQLWTVPIFAVGCVVVPIAAYTLMMRGYRQAHPAVTYRASNEAPRPIHMDSHPQFGRSTAVDAAGMPIRSASDYLALDAGGARKKAAHAEATAKTEAETATNVEEKVAKGSLGVTDGSPEGATSSQNVDALIDEYLVEENEDEEGLFEPELSPTLSPRTTTVEETSAMMLTVPYGEGDEHYLVVSESTSVPNPILAYRRTTSSRLVPLGPNGRFAPPAPGGDDNITVPPGTPVWFPLRPAEEELPPAKATAGPEHAAPSPAVEEPVEEPELFPEPSGPSPALGFTDFINFVEVEPEPEPAAAIQPELFSLEPEPVAEPEPAAEPESVEIVEPAAEPEPATVPAAPAPTVEPEPAAVPRPAVSAFQVAGKRAETIPESAPAPAAPVAEAPAPADTPATASFDAFMAKADGLRAKGLYPVAARLYGEAAQAAATHADAHRAQFDEIACYVKCGQSEKARALAAQLRASSVLTRVERIKLDAIERMG